MKRDHVEHIKGKKPAHSDHRARPYNSNRYMEGGDDGFNHRDGVTGDTMASDAGLAPSERGNIEDSTTSFGGGLTVPKP